MKILLNKNQSNLINDIVFDNYHMKFMCSVLNSVAKFSFMKI